MLEENIVATRKYLFHFCISSLHIHIFVKHRPSVYIYKAIQSFTGRRNFVSCRKGDSRNHGPKYPSQKPVHCPRCFKYITQARNLKKHLSSCNKNLHDEFFETHHFLINTY